MKKIFNKSEIMKLAHNLMKRKGFNRSLALKMAWTEAKRNEFYWIIPVSKPKDIMINYSNPVVQQSLVDYYNRLSGSYCGD